MTNTSVETPLKEKKIKIARTRSGVPCLWESTMKFADLRRATTILGSEGNAKPAVFLNREKEKQALVPIVLGDHIAKVFEDKHGLAFSIFKITEISPMENTASIIPIYTKSSLVTSTEVPIEFASMINTCMDKLENPKNVISYMNTSVTTA